MSEPYGIKIRVHLNPSNQNPSHNRCIPIEIKLGPHIICTNAHIIRGIKFPKQ